MKRLHPLELLVILLAACNSPPPPPPIAHVPPPPPPDTATPAPRPPDLRAFVCADRTPCEIRRERKAGVSASGQQLSVVSVYTGIQSQNEDRRDEHEDAGAGDPGIQESDRGDVITSALDGGACHRFEYWLFTRRGKDTIVSARPLVHVCNEGHGASMIGADHITIGDNTFDYSTSGGSSWRWGERTVLSLSPLRPVERDSMGTWALGPNRHEASWNFDYFSGSVTWYSPPCDANGEPRADAWKEDRDDMFTHASIPAVDLDASFAASEWKTTALGDCSLLVDSEGLHGFIVHGEPGAPDDASMRVVASKNRELFIEVRDDHWIGPSARWVRDDHLELWLARKLPSYMDHCLAEGGESPKQWGIRMADGKVFQGFGKPDVSALAVERSSAAGGAVRFKILLPRGFEAITVVYSDSDDGKKQERLIATSRLSHGKRETLGALRRIDPKDASCAALGGTLRPVRSTIVAPEDRPIL